jgi:hypothetical protein
MWATPYGRLSLSKDGKQAGREDLLVGETRLGALLWCCTMV